MNAGLSPPWFTNTLEQFLKLFIKNILDDDNINKLLVRIASLKVHSLHRKQVYTRPPAFSIISLVIVYFPPKPLFPSYKPGLPFVNNSFYPHKNKHDCNDLYVLCLFIQHNTA